MNPHGGEVPDWQQRIKDDIGENPARFLDRRIPNPPAPNSMFRARVRGIDRIRVVGAWIATEKRLRRGISEDDLPEGVTDPHAVDVTELGLEPGRSHVLRLLRERRDYLQENGERPQDLTGSCEVPERFRRRTSRRVPEKHWYIVERDESGAVVDRTPYAEKRSESATAKLDRLRDSAVAADGGDSR